MSFNTDDIRERRKKTKGLKRQKDSSKEQDKRRLVPPKLKSTAAKLAKQLKATFFTHLLPHLMLVKHTKGDRSKVFML